MNNKELTAKQLLLGFVRDCIKVRTEERIFKSPLISFNNEGFNYYFSETGVYEILQLKGVIEISFAKSACQYEKLLEELIENATDETVLPEYLYWLKQNNFKVNIKDIDFIKVCAVKTDSNQVQMFRELSGLDKNLTLSYPWFFFFYSCWFKNQYSPDKGGIGYSHQEDNNGIQRHFEDKKFIHKDFEITKEKRYVFRISVEADGQFQILLSNEFVNNLICLIARSSGQKEGTTFTPERESIHFVYVTDEFCTSREVVILSMQAFGLGDQS